MTPETILFIDIESVPATQDFPEGQLGELFKSKYKKEMIDAETTMAPIHYSTKLWKEKAAFHAEFGKIVCISIGRLHKGKFVVKSIASRDEKGILISFADSIEKSKCVFLCGHNALEFDYRFLFQRYVINGLSVPEILNVGMKKPWEVNLLDTMKMWGGTSWNYKASLDLIAHCLGIPSPKSEMDGSKVADVYYGSFNVESGELPFDKEEEALKVIGNYCNGDVITDYKVWCRLSGIEYTSEIEIA